MQIDDELYKQLVEYLARRPWHEVNGLLAKLAAARRPEITTPAPVGDKER